MTKALQVVSNGINQSIYFFLAFSVGHRPPSTSRNALPLSISSTTVHVLKKLRERLLCRSECGSSLPHFAESRRPPLRQCSTEPPSTASPPSASLRTRVKWWFSPTGRRWPTGSLSLNAASYGASPFPPSSPSAHHMRILSPICASKYHILPINPKHISFSLYIHPYHAIIPPTLTPPTHTPYRHLALALPSPGPSLGPPR